MLGSGALLLECERLQLLQLQQLLVLYSNHGTQQGVVWGILVLNTAAQHVCGTC